MSIDGFLDKKSINCYGENIGKYMNNFNRQLNLQAIWPVVKETSDYGQIFAMFGLGGFYKYRM